MLSMVLLPFISCFSTSSFNFINIQYIFYIHSLGKQWSSNLELLPSFLSYAMDILLANNFFFLVFFFFYQFYYSYIHLTCSVISSIKSNSSFLRSYFFSFQFPNDIALFYCYSSLSILICLLLIIYFCYLSIYLLISIFFIFHLPIVSICSHTSTIQLGSFLNVYCYL